MNQNWRVDANCIGVDVNVFFLESNLIPQEIKVKLAEARSYCDSCTVQRQCLQYAIDENVIGIYGGMTVDQRRGVKRSLGIRSKPGSKKGNIFHEVK